MTALKFDEPELVRSLERLPASRRVAFAAACAERLQPTYLSFAERTEKVKARDFQAIMDRLWLDLGGRQMTYEEINMNIERCMGLTPHEDDEPWDDSQVYAENAGLALVYALRCRQGGESQEAAWAARHVYEALDHYVIAQEDIDVTAPDAEARVLSHPLIQAELSRQKRDLQFLCISQADLAFLREQARREAQRMFMNAS